MYKNIKKSIIFFIAGVLCSCGKEDITVQKNDSTKWEIDKKVEDKDYYLISDGTITNIDENQQKENKKEIIKEVKGEKAAKEVDTHKDIQLEAAIKFLNTPTQKNTPSPKK